MNLDHPTAADIIERLRERGQNFAYGTIYNSLRYLTLKLGDSASRYDATVDEHQHIGAQPQSEKLLCRH